MPAEPESMVSTWHPFTRKTSPDAATIAAPLFISGIKLRHYWRGNQIVEPDLLGRIDTGSAYTVIPVKLVVRMSLKIEGKLEGLKGFDKGVELPIYPQYKVDLWMPQVGWKSIRAIACQRNDILLGLDVCRGMFLLANWRREHANGCVHGFGIRPAHQLHQFLSILFRQLKPVHQDTRIDHH